jgi:REP element-mobilizing transposase RayT
MPRDFVGGERSPQPETAGKAFAMADRLADRAISDPLWLKDPRVAQVVKNALLHGERGRSFYTLRAWVIMPNHVHVLLEPNVTSPIITRWLKGSTARRANQILGRTGQTFWQDESFDRWVRSGVELARVEHYIEFNPVSAGFVTLPEAWPLSSARKAGESACSTF